MRPSRKQCALLLLLLATGACGQPPAPVTRSPPASPRPATSAPANSPVGASGAQRCTAAVCDRASFVRELRQRGVTVAVLGATGEGPFPTLRGTRLRISGASLKDAAVLEVYELGQIRVQFAPGGTIEEVAPNGQRSVSVAEWVEPPHFFGNERLVVLYVGTDTAVLGVLRSILGRQISPG